MCHYQIDLKIKTPCFTRHNRKQNRNVVRLKLLFSSPNSKLTTKSKPLNTSYQFSRLQQLPSKSAWKILVIIYFEPFQSRVYNSFFPLEHSAYHGQRQIRRSMFAPGVISGAERRDHALQAYYDNVKRNASNSLLSPESFVDDIMSRTSEIKFLI